ncbi:MAG: transcription antitermination factor NusB [bacterium]|nr:transcription antitermination factor NusB [bacterium]
MSPRRKGRELAAQALYQCDLGASEAEEALSLFRPAEYGTDDGEVNARQGPPTPQAPETAASKKSFTYAQALVRGTLDNLQEIDDLIRGQAEHWRLERMPAVDRNILRLAVYEFLYEPDVPKLVIVDEAIELAKKFGSKDSGRFVNGLLDGLLKKRQFPGVMS